MKIGKHLQLEIGEEVDPDGDIEFCIASNQEDLILDDMFFAHLTIEETKKLISHLRNVIYKHDGTRS